MTVQSIESLQEQISKDFDPKAAKIIINFMYEISEYFYKMSDLDKEKFLDDKNPELHDGRECSFSCKFCGLENIFDELENYKLFWKYWNSKQLELEQLKKINEIAGCLFDLRMTISNLEQLLVGPALSAKISCLDHLKNNIENTIKLLKLEFNSKFSDFMKIKNENPDIRPMYYRDDWELYSDLSTQIC